VQTIKAENPKYHPKETFETAKVKIYIRQMLFPAINSN